MEPETQDFSSELAELLQVSRRTGERWDLVQAGGGNTSVKFTDGRMFIKASGIRLASMSSEEHLAAIDNRRLRESFTSFLESVPENRAQREERATRMVAVANLNPARRPSIETLLHSMLDGAVIHTHPLPVLALFSDKNAVNRCQSLLPECVFVPYETPGIDLAISMFKQAQEFEKIRGTKAHSFILQNHGLVVSGSNPTAAFSETENICGLLAEKIGFPIQEERYANQISETLSALIGEPWVTVASTIKVESVNVSRPYFPDGVVFFSSGVLQISPATIESDIRNFIDETGTPPRAFRLNDRFYFSGPGLTRALESEEVFRMHILAQSFGLKPDALADDEIQFLSHWEAEKYRQRL